MIYIKLLYPFFVYNKDIRKENNKDMITKTKIIPQLTGEFNFITHSNNGFLTHNKISAVKVKINKIEKEINVSTKKTGWGDNVSYVVYTNISYVFKDLLDENSDVDCTFIDDEYIIQRDKAIELDTILRTKTYKEEYKNWWAHQLNDIETEDISVNIPTDEEYINSKFIGNSVIKPSITYKGVTNEIYHYNVGYYNGNNKMVYVLQGQVTKHKKRNYSTIKNLIEKFIQLAEFKIASDKAADIAKENIRIEQELKIKYLTKVFGDLITTQTDYQRRNFPNRISPNNFYINIDDRYCPILFYKNNDEILYNFLGQQNLTEKQVKGLIEGLKKK